MVMDKIQLLTGVADTILEEPTRVEVDITNPRWWEKIGIKLKLVKPKRIFFIKPATLGTMIRVSRLLLEVDTSVYNTGLSVLDTNYVMLDKHGEALVKAFAMAIDNTKAGPSKKLISFLENNLTSDDLPKISKVILSQLNVSPFMNTIILMRGGMSLLKPGEKIASGEPSEEL